MYEKSLLINSVCLYLRKVRQISEEGERNSGGDFYLIINCSNDFTGVYICQILSKLTL